MPLFRITEAEIVTRQYVVDGSNKAEAIEKWRAFDREVLHADQTTRVLYDREMILCEDVSPEEAKGFD